MLIVYDIHNSPLNTVPRVGWQLWARIHLIEDIRINRARYHIGAEALRSS